MSPSASNHISPRPKIELCLSLVQEHTFGTDVFSCTNDLSKDNNDNSLVKCGTEDKQKLPNG